MTTAFLLTALLVVATPGTGVIYTLASALARGWRAGLLAAFASTLGILPHLLAAVTGAAALLHASALAFSGLKIAGVAYLLWMAVGMLRDGGGLDLDRPAPPRGALSVIRTGVLINLLNPKLTIFFFAFLPQFVAPDAPGATLAMLELGGVFMAITFAVFSLYGLAAARLRAGVLSRPRLVAALRRGFAAAFALMGLRLAFAGR